MGLRGIEATLPPGFRFYPRDEELVCHYLCKKIANETLAEETMVEVDLHTCEPWQLPDATKLGANEWYFFSFRDRKYATGLRANRATKSGYWKATGKDRSIFNPTTGKIVGMRKTLVFYLERAPNGKKTSWVMHEFRLGSPDMPPKENWVLCRVFHKSKGGPSTQFRRLSTQFRLEGHQPIRDCPSPNIESSTPIQHTMPYKQMISLSTTPHQEDNSPPNSMLNLAVLHCNFFDFPHYLDEMSNSRGGDEYGFLVDLGLEDQSMEDAELMDFLQ